MKSKFVFLLLFLFTCNLLYSQTTFVHCVGADNHGHRWSIIDNAAVNGKKNVYLFVQKVRVDDNGTIVSNPEPIAVMFLEFTQKWEIGNINPNNETPPVNSCYMITVWELPENNYTYHEAESFTILPGFANISVIDNPILNDNASARSIVTQVQDSVEVTNNNASAGSLVTKVADTDKSAEVTNNDPIELWYNWGSPGKWYISVPPGQSMPIGAKFNILTNPEGFTIYEHESTADNIGSSVVAIDDYAYWTVLDHVLLNNNPDAILFVTHRKEPATTFIYKSFSVFYNSVTGKWQLHIELENYISDYSFPVGNLFDIFIYNSTVGVDDLTQNKEVKIFPNPTNTMFNIKSNGNIYEVLVYNILGQEIEKISGINENTSKIDVSNYQRGTYFVKVKTEVSFETVKLIKY